MPATPGSVMPSGDSSPQATDGLLPARTRWIAAAALVALEIAGWIAFLAFEGEWGSWVVLLVAPILALACGAIAGLRRGLATTVVLWLTLYAMHGLFAGPGCDLNMSIGPPAGEAGVNVAGPGAVSVAAVQLRTTPFVFAAGSAGQVEAVAAPVAGVNCNGAAQISSWDSGGWHLLIGLLLLLATAIGGVASVIWRVVSSKNAASKTTA